jgi:hypothetical protein
MCPNSSTVQEGADRRAYPRGDVHGFASVARFPLGALLTPQWVDWLLQTCGVAGALLDVSRNGFSLVLLQPLLPGEVVVARLARFAEPAIVDVAAEVVRVVDLGDGRWKIVATMRPELSFEAAYELSH